MSIALAPQSVEVDPAEPTTSRVSLADLVELGTARLTAPLHRALPDVDPGQVPVAAFQSSI